MSKKYYWLKIEEHFFESDEVIYLESIEKGDTYIKIWMKILLKCLKDKDKQEYGFLRFNDKIPYDDKLLSKIIKVDINDLRVAMKIFQELGMISLLDDKTIYIDSVQKMIGKESDSAERMRIHRAKRKLLEASHSDMDVVTSDPNKEVNVNVEIEKEVESKKEQPEAKASPYCKDKEKRQAIIDLFYSNYEELYDKKLTFDKKAIGCINNLLKYPMPEIEEKSELLIKKCKDRKDDFHIYIPSMLLSQWFKLVRKPSIYGK